MGVHDLWKLVEPSSQPLRPSSLRGKVLAVDISVWMHQFVHGIYMNDSNDGLGETEEEERRSISVYLQNLFIRFCKLWCWGVKIVVVFDGQTPLIKKRTVAKRAKQKRQDEKKLQIVAKKLLRNRLEGVALGQLSSGKKKKRSEEDDEFYFALPKESSEAKREEMNDSFDGEDLNTPTKSDILNDLRNYDFDEQNEIDLSQFVSPEKAKQSTPPKQIYGETYYDYDIDSIDPELFKSLPTATQQLILKTLRRSKRYTPADKLSTLQSQKPESFSSAQLNNFINGRNAHRKLQQIIQENQEQREYEELSKKKLLTPKLEAEVQDMEYTGGQLASDSNTEFILFSSPASQRSSQSQTPSTSSSQLFSPSLEISGDEVEEEGGFVRPSTQAKRMSETIEIEDDDDDFESVNINTVDEPTMIDDDEDEFESVLVNEKSDDNDEFETVPTDEEGISIRVDPAMIDPSDELISKELFPASLFENAKTNTEIITLDEEEINPVAKVLFPADIFEQSGKSSEEEQITINDDDDEFETVVTEGDIIEEDLTTDENKQSTEVEQASRFTSDSPVLAKSKASLYDDPANWEYAEEVKEDETEPITTQSKPRRSEETITLDDKFLEEEEEESIDVIEKKPAKSQKAKGKQVFVENSEHQTTLDLTETSLPKDALLSFEVPDASVSAELAAEREKMIAQMHDQLAKEKVALQRELRRTKKNVQSISENLISLTRRMLQVLGIPYVDSPYETDAQCGFLSQHGLVDGVISEDSDMLLFGCNIIYRKFFGNDTAQVYTMDHIEEVLGLTRREFVQLGMLLGGDYTDGVHGVGPVTGIQICAAFNKIYDDKKKKEKQQSKKSDDQQFIDSIIEPLKLFAEWLSSPNEMFDDTGGFKFKYKNIKKNFVLPPHFPDHKVADAYINGEVDRSTEPFTFGTFGSSSAGDETIAIDVNPLYRYCEEHIGWNKATVDHHLRTVINQQKKTAGTLENFIARANRKAIRSEGIKRAVKHLTAKRKREKSEAAEPQKKVARRK